MSNWVKVAKQSALPEGEMIAVNIGELRLALYNVGGDFFATDNLCTHGNALLTNGYLDDDVVECPLHAGRFNVKSGQGLGAPITCNIKAYPTRKTGDDIEIEIDAPSSH